MLPLILLLFSTTLSSFRLPFTLAASQSRQSIATPKAVAFIVPISQTITMDGCDFTITHNIAYIFDDATHLLLGIVVSQQYYVQVQCEPGSFYARPGSEINFEVSKGELIDVQFSITNGKLAPLFYNPSFKQIYLELIKANMPSFR